MPGQKNCGTMEEIDIDGILEKRLVEYMRDPSHAPLSLRSSIQQATKNQHQKSKFTDVEVDWMGIFSELTPRIVKSQQATAIFHALMNENGGYRHGIARKVGEWQTTVEYWLDKFEKWQLVNKVIPPEVPGARLRVRYYLRVNDLKNVILTIHKVMVEEYGLRKLDAAINVNKSKDKKNSTLRVRKFRQKKSNSSNQ